MLLRWGISDGLCGRKESDLRRGIRDGKSVLPVGLQNVNLKDDMLSGALKGLLSCPDLPLDSTVDFLLTFGITV